MKYFVGDNVVRWFWLLFKYFLALVLVLQNVCVDGANIGLWLQSSA